MLAIFTRPSGSSVSIPQPLHSPVRYLAAGVLAFLVLRPFLSLGHEFLVLGLAWLTRFLTDLTIWQELIWHLPLDPVYTLAVVKYAGEIQARGLAVAAPVGNLLHAVLPGFFQAPDVVADGAWVSAVLEPGATVLARVLVAFAADTALLAVGLALVLAGWGKRPWLVVCGALQQAHVGLYHYLDHPLSLQDLEAAGLPFAISTLTSQPEQRSPWFTAGLADLPQPLVSLAAGLCALLLAYLVAGLLVGLSWLALRLALRHQHPSQAPRVLQAGRRRAPAAIMAMAVAFLAASPIGAFAEAETAMLDLPEPAPLASPATGVSPSISAPARRGPTPVSFVGESYRFTLLVDGVPQVVRGMGYNVEYSHLSREERAARYDRDFPLIRASGVNVIFGWFQDEFDELTLDKARHYGLGVGLPFELNQDFEYADPAVRARLTDEVLAWVNRYKDHPAVWFWTPGNEVIHRLIFPAWLKRETDPVREARADAFAAFYVDLIDQIHAADPAHPVIYRDAEEVYLGRIRDNLLRSGVKRPWFAYGANIYSRRLDEILETWPQQGIDVPLLVSEFGPGGTGPSDRPQALRSIWSTIRAHPDWVIGGAVYTWTTDGPEELDRVFGLVDGDARPIGDSLATLAQLYRSDPAQ